MQFLTFEDFIRCVPGTWDISWALMGEADKAM